MASKCSICLDRLSDPRSTRCAHVFCYSCIKMAIFHRHECPTCRTPIKSHRDLLATEDASLHVSTAHVQSESYSSGASTGMHGQAGNAFGARLAEATELVNLHRPPTAMHANPAATHANPDATYAAEAEGRRVSVWWGQDGRWFNGTVHKFCPGIGMHRIRYDDGDRRLLRLATEEASGVLRWISTPAPATSSRAATPPLPSSLSSVRLRSGHGYASVEVPLNDEVAAPEPALPAEATIAAEESLVRNSLGVRPSEPAAAPRPDNSWLAHEQAVGSILSDSMLSRSRFSGRIRQPKIPFINPHLMPQTFQVFQRRSGHGGGKRKKPLAAVEEGQLAAAEVGERLVRTIPNARSQTHSPSPRKRSKSGGGSPQPNVPTVSEEDAISVLGGLPMAPIPKPANSSGYKGVFKGRGGRWQAQAGHKGIGGFATAFEAGVAVAQAEYRAS